MYEQDGVPVYRRGLWIVLGFIVAVAVLWLLVWLIFFRHSNPKVSNLHGSNTNKQSQSHNNQPSSGSSSNKSGSGSGSQNTQQSGSGTNNGSSSSAGGGSSTPSAPGSQPSQLANTGAGDVVVPFVVASAAGGALYYVRLRKKLLS